MSLNIKNPEVVRLVAEVSAITGESKTEAIRRALEERKLRLVSALGKSRSSEELLEQLRSRIWSQIPDSLRGRGIAYLPVEELLGLGPEGI